MNLNNKHFTIINNSKNGKVNSQTKFYYKEENAIITAIYSGGGISNGNIIGIRLNATKILINYHCITEDLQLKSGKAEVTLSKNIEGLIEMNLKWEWLEVNGKKGKSTYLEVVK